MSARFAADWRLVAALARRDPNSPLVFHRNGIAIRRWRTAWRTACQAAGVPTRFLHECRRTAARNPPAPDGRRHATVLQSWMQRQNWEFETHRPQDPRHLRPLQHHQRTGTPRGRGSAGRLSGAARTGDAPWARAPGPPAPRAAPPPRATHHRVRAPPRCRTPDGVKRGHQRGRPGNVTGHRAVSRSPLFGVKYFCRSTSTILAGSDGCSFDDAPFGWALLRVLKTQKTKRRERPLGDVHGVR